MHESKRCGAKRGNGELCKSWAMKNGTGKCRKHGGKAGRPPIHGRYSFKLRASLKDKVQRHLADPEPMSLLSELATMRALFEDFGDKFTEGRLTKETRTHAFMMLETIGKLVERIDRIFNRDALTAAEVIYLQVALADVVLQFLPPEKITPFWNALRARTGGISDLTRTARSSKQFTYVHDD